MQNYYELLGVSRSASPAVAKIAYEGKLKALDRAEIAEAEKAAERRDLERAYVTLGNPAKKAWYDGQLDRHVEADVAAGEASSGRGLKIAAVVAVVVIGAAAWSLIDRARENERIRLEEQRIALEREKAVKEAELARARLELDQQRLELQRDVQASHGAARDRVITSVERNLDAARASQAARDRQAALDNAQRQRLAQDASNRAAADAERRRAQADVDRQKQFVRQREIEDERVRQDRYIRAQYEEAKRKAAEAAASRPH